jgi:hypothetical protein
MKEEHLTRRKWYTLDKWIMSFRTRFWFDSQRTWLAVLGVYPSIISGFQIEKGYRNGVFPGGLGGIAATADGCSAPG